MESVEQPKAEWSPDDLQLVGYFHKDTRFSGNYQPPSHVEEICSVSDHVNSNPDGWIDHWLHNELGFYNTRADSHTVVAGANGFSLFAHRMLPVSFGDQREERIPMPPLAVEPLDDTFVSLGFDAASKSITPFFECSPLSCCYLAEEVPVNRFCLVSTFGEALQLARRLGLGEAEPGPYYVFEVLRQSAPLDQQGGLGGRV